MQFLVSSIDALNLVSIQKVCSVEAAELLKLLILRGKILKQAKLRLCFGFLGKFDILIFIFHMHSVFCTFIVILSKLYFNIKEISSSMNIIWPKVLKLLEYYE